MSLAPPRSPVFDVDTPAPGLRLAIAQYEGAALEARHPSLALSFSEIGPYQTLLVTRGPYAYVVLSDPSYASPLVVLRSDCVGEDGGRPYEIVRKGETCFLRFAGVDKSVVATEIAGHEAEFDAAWSAMVLGSRALYGTPESYEVPRMHRPPAVAAPARSAPAA